MKSKPQSGLEWHKIYDNVDGTGEMLMGLMFLAFALLSYLQTLLPENSIWKTNLFAMLLFMYGVLALVLVPAYSIRWGIKKYITWPRTGYVAGGVGAHHFGGSNAKAKKSYWVAMVTIAVVAAVIACGFACLFGFERKYLGRHFGVMTILAAAGYVAYLAMWVGLYAFWIKRIGQGLRWKRLVCLFMALGLLVIGLIGPGQVIGFTRLVMCFVGGMWIISGMGTFCSYLWHTKPPSPETE